MRTILKSLLAAAMFAVSSLSAAAQPILEDAFDMIHACRHDADRFCADVPPGGGRIALCLSLYRNELSPLCYKAITIGIAIRACRYDYLHLCPGVLPGEGRVIECLGAQAEEVSSSCKRALKAALVASGLDEHRGGYGGEKPYYKDRENRYGYGTRDDRRPYEQGDGRFDREDDDEDDREGVIK